MRVRVYVNVRVCAGQRTTVELVLSSIITWLLRLT